MALPTDLARILYTDVQARNKAAHITRFDFDDKTNSYYAVTQTAVQKGCEALQTNRYQQKRSHQDDVWNATEQRLYRKGLPIILLDKIPLELYTAYQEANAQHSGVLDGRALSDAMWSIINSRTEGILKADVEAAQRIITTYLPRQLPALVETVSPDQSPSRRPPPSPTVFNIPVQNIFWIAENTVVTPIDSESGAFANGIPIMQHHIPVWSSKSTLRDFKECLEDGGSRRHISREDIHQSVAMTALLRVRHNRNVVARKFSWLQTNLSRIASIQQFGVAAVGDRMSAVLWLARDAHEADSAEYDHIFDTVIRVRCLFGGTFRCYPSREECMAADMKIGDVIALDECAAAPASVHKFRPITCFGYSGCKLQDQDSVQKRSSSWGSQNVTVVRAQDADQQLQVMCNSLSVNNNRRKRTQYINQGDQHFTYTKLRWFHQQFIDSFTSFGELRVYITAVPDSTGLRRRRGEIAVVAKTDFLPNKEMSVRRIQAEDFLHITPLSELDLRTFALYVYDNLRARDDWFTSFESLEVGVRLDITVSPRERGSTRQFFVNEITRWYEASFFSRNLCALPHDALIARFAQAFHEYFPPSS